MAKLTTVLLIVGTGLGTTGKNLDIHQMHQKTGATGEYLASVARNQTGFAHHNINNNPFSHIDGRGQNQHNGGPQRSQHREQASAAPRGEQMDNNPNFPLGDSSTPILMKGTTGDTLLPHSLHWHLTL